MNAILPWLGGKRRLAAVIAGHLERLPHGHYVEPFCGAGHVFFRKIPAAGEVLADRNAELMVLYRVLQRHLEEFLRHFRWALVSRTEFERQKAARPDTLTNVQRAVRFYYLQKLAFGGRAIEQSFGVDTLHRPRINLLRLEETLSAVHRAWPGWAWSAGTGARAWPATTARTRCSTWTRPTTGSRTTTARASSRARTLRSWPACWPRCRGRFMLSLNDWPEVREIFGAFEIAEVTTRYSVNVLENGGSGIPDLLIGNVGLE